MFEHRDKYMKTWTPYVAIWSLLALIVLILAAYRKMLAGHEDATLHVAEGTKGLIPEQIATAQKLEVVDKWGKLLTVVVVVAGLAMTAIYIYNIFQSGSTTVTVQ